MAKSPKTISRQARRQARSEKRSAFAQETRASRQKPSFEDEHVRPPHRPKTEPLVALTDTQAEYDDCIDEARITFGIGPAGTGKTYYATRLACMALDAKEVSKIYLTRPAVEAGESLGFLPGELEEKYEPYLRPFKDALFDHFGQTHTEYLIKKGVIEPVPLGFLRGATFKNCWVLLDEAQNTTPAQMKMFLTRIGDNSKMIVNGDLKQKDIPGPSGLKDALHRFEGKPEIGVTHFRSEDIVRSGICRMIVEGYEND